MGKNLTPEYNLRFRHEKVSYMEVEDGKFYRIEGFTDLSTSREPLTYDRHYVDEKSPREDVIAVKTSMDFTFDHYEGHPVQEEIIKIIDREKTGNDAVRNIVVVDFRKNATKTGEYPAVKRPFSITPGEEGAGNEAYTYSGSFAANGEPVHGFATSDDEFDTITFKDEAASEI